MTIVRPPLRRVVYIYAASVMLECGHLHDRSADRSDVDQPRRMYCAVCLPLKERREWMKRNVEKRRMK